MNKQPPETKLARAGIAGASTVLICIPDDAAALHIVHEMRRSNAHAIVLVRCRYRANVEALSKAGANEVVCEEFEAGSAVLRSLASIEGAN